MITGICIGFRGALLLLGAVCLIVLLKSGTFDQDDD